MSTGIKFLSSSGLGATLRFDVEAVADNVGMTASYGGSINNQTKNALTFKKSFSWEPTVALNAGWITTPEDRLRVLVLLGIGQSNIQGRGYNVSASAIVNSQFISPNSYPYDEVSPVDSDVRGVGPLLPLADYLLSDGVPYDYVMIVSTAQGSNSLVDLYGTNGTDGTYRAQIDNAAVCGGIEGTNPAPLIKPWMDVVLIHGQGEDEAVSGNVTNWAFSTSVWMDHITNNDFPSNNFKAVCITRFASASAGGATQDNWNSIRSQQASLADASATPPRFVFSYTNSEQEPGDTIHYTTPGQERIAQSMADVLVPLLNLVS